jgi:hypothetical protein
MVCITFLVITHGARHIQIQRGEFSDGTKILDYFDSPFNKRLMQYNQLKQERVNIGGTAKEQAVYQPWFIFRLVSNFSPTRPLVRMSALMT